VKNIGIGALFCVMLWYIYEFFSPENVQPYKYGLKPVQQSFTLRYMKISNKI